jgi:hypothetical protein
MRTIVEIDDALLAEAKKLAIDTGRTLTQVLEDSLRTALAQRDAQKPIKFHTSKVGGGVQPGVDISNNAALLDLMDEYDGFTAR